MNIEPDLSAERAVLSGILKYGKQCLAELEEVIGTDTFNELDNRVIYKCLSHALNDVTTVDYPTLLSAASELGLYEAISKKEQTEYIKSLFVFPIKEDNVLRHAIKLKKIEVRRELCSRLKQACQDLVYMDGTESINEIQSIAESPILDYMQTLNSTDTGRPEKLFAGVYEELEYRAENPCEIVGIPTGYSVYDRIIGGGQRAGSVNLVVARTGVGKTMHAKSVCMHIASKLNIPVLMIDSEMDKSDQVNRAIADATETDINDVETGKFGRLTKKKDIFKFVRENEDMPYFHKSTPMMDFDDLISMIRRWLLVEVGVDENGNRKPCLIAYDYFKVMNQKNIDHQSEFQTLGFQMDKVSQLCKKYNASCLAYVQANRDGISDEDLRIVAQSDRLSWFASSVCLLKEKTAEEIQADIPVGLLGNARLLILKSRYGPKYLGDYIEMNKQGEYSRIRELGLASELKNANNQSQPTI